MTNDPVAIAGRLRNGEVIALPTETVYGLAADATNAEAVAKIFALKGRPSSNPLIVHVADVERAKRFAADWPAAADALAKAFWPGPMTIVVKRQPVVADAVTAGGDTVALRVPNHPLTLKILDAFDGGLAAPSANRSNYISPTAAKHVRDEFGSKVDVIDGGPCAFGIESTVVDVSSGSWRILRPGSITESQVAALLPLPLREGVGGRGPQGVLSTATGTNSAENPSPQSSPSRGEEAGAFRSPGQLAVHYAPQTPAYRFDLAQRPRLDLSNAAIVEPTLDPETFARNLYARLRLLDSQGLDAIYVELPPDTPPWRAVRDRLFRATRPLPSTT